jgi:hypothetical protein
MVHGGQESGYRSQRTPFQGHQEIWQRVRIAGGAETWRLINRGVVEDELGGYFIRPAPLNAVKEVQFLLPIGSFAAGRGYTVLSTDPSVTRHAVE